MSAIEIQRDAVQMMRIQGVLKFIGLDPRVAKPVIASQQFLLKLLRECPVEEFT